MFCKMKREVNTNANVVDGKLILSFPEALTPIVWQMDLNEAKTCSFEVIEEGGQFKLISKMQGSTKKEVIAPFSDRNTAVGALMATSNALANGQGRIAANANAAMPMAAPTAAYTIQPERTSSAGKWIFAVASIVLIVVLFSWATSMQPRSVSSMGASGNAAMNDMGAPASEKAGVPVSADDYLRSR